MSIQKKVSRTNMVPGCANASFGLRRLFRIFCVAIVLAPTQAEIIQEGTDLYFSIAKLLTLDVGTWDHITLNPCLGWAYITCNDNKTHVTGLNIGSRNVSGSLSPYIGNLTYLTNLNVANNNLTGVIPSTMKDLVNLRFLDLSNNKFSGRIPEAIGNITTISTLNMSSNLLSGSIPVGLVPNYDRCSSFLDNPNLCSDSCYNIKACSAGGHKFSPFHPPPPSPPPSPPPLVAKKESNNLGPVIGGLVGGLVVIALLLVLLIFMVRRKRAQLGDEQFDDLELAVRDRHYGQLQRYSKSDMEKATDDFNASNLLGHGGFGKVYKGKLPSGTIVAIKLLKDSRKNSKGEKAFLNELDMISKATHKNLINLLGFCIERGERILVFPYKPNGSVANHFHGRRAPAAEALPWDVRMRIALGTAQGLAYMHYDCSPKLIHRDVKAANILLNEDFSPVVGDFGLAMLLDIDITHVTTGVEGTLGHIAPEYLQSGQTSEKTDVFGFGVFLLELAAGKTALEISDRPNSVNLREWVVDLLVRGSVKEVVDQDLRDSSSYDPQEMVQMLQVAIFCMTATPQDRPTMNECVTMLQGRELADRWSRWREEVNPVDVTGYAAGIQFRSEDGTDLANSMEAFVLSGPR